MKDWVVQVAGFRCCEFDSLGETIDYLKDCPNSDCEVTHTSDETRKPFTGNVLDVIRQLQTDQLMSPLGDKS
jgi:hypothetical protein